MSLSRSPWSSLALGQRRSRRSGPWLDAELGAEAMGRHLSYNDDLFHQMNTYDLTAAPGLYGRAAFYPGALSARARRVDVRHHARW